MKYQNNGSTQWIYRICGVNILTIHRSYKLFWFRIFGKGLVFKHESLGLTFSQRFGKTKYTEMFGWIITFAPKKKI